MKLTLSYAKLRRWRACEDEQLLALLHFGPEPRPVTRELLLEAAELGLNVAWLYWRVRAEAWKRDNIVLSYPHPPPQFRGSGKRFCRSFANAIADGLGLP